MNTPMREVELVDSIVAQLPNLLPNLDLRKTRREWQTPSGDRADIIVEAWSGKSRTFLILEAKSSGEPRTALAAVTQLRRLVRGLSAAYPVFCAPFVSPASRELLKEEGIGYLDLSGNALLRFGEVLVDRSSPDPSPRRRRGTRELLAPKSTRVLRALLNNPGQAFGVRELATLCRLSPAAVVFAARLLQDKAFVERDAQRRIILARPGPLLEFWASAWSIERNGVARYFSAAPEPRDIMEAVSRLAVREGLDYGLTLQAGASLVAPFVRFSEVWLYAPGDLRPWIEGLDLAPATAGANVCLLSPYDAGVLDFSQEIKKKRVVSDAQLFVDLYNFPARGREQAEFLRDRRLRFGRAK